MPSASGKTSQNQLQVSSSDLLQDPLKNALQVFEKKQRNLEKRKVKLVETKKKAEKGGELNEDQKLALANLTLVDNSLETVKDLHKSVSQLEQEYNRQVKKEQKRSKQEQRDQAEAKTKTFAFKVIEVQCVLNSLTEDVQPSFRTGTNGACMLTEDELSYLNTIYELINSEEKKLSVRVKTTGEHLINLIEGKEKEVAPGVSYKQVLEVIDKVIKCGYFDKGDTDTSGTGEPKSPIEPELEETPVESDSPVETPVTEDEYPATHLEEVQSKEEEVAAQEAVPVNGVDLPPEVQQSPEDEKIDFLGESEITNQATTEQTLNPVSPEFVPRNLKNANDDGWNENESSGGWQSGENTNTSSEWQSVPDSNAHGGQQRDGHRGRGGRNNRGFGGRGRGRGNFRGGQRDGNYRGSSRGTRGGSRGSRGGQRGGNKGGSNRGGGSGSGFGRPQNQ